MTNDTSQLRLYSAPVPSQASGDTKRASDFFEQLQALCVTFRRATGWSLRYVAGSPPSGASEPSIIDDRILEWSAPADAGVGTTPGHLRIDLLKTPAAEDKSDSAACGFRAPAAQGDAEAVCALATSMAEIFNQRSALDREVRARDAQLAVIAVSPTTPCDPGSLAERLEAIVRGGAQALGCDAAAMYVLDDATTRLDIRASWAISGSQRLEVSRKLERATADLEALLGHAVVLEDDLLFDLWGVPDRQFSAAVCVPITGSTTVLGTFWMFSSDARDFKPTETNLIEILAGRLACELELASQSVQRRPRPT